MEPLATALRRARTDPEAPAIVAPEVTLGWAEFADTAVRLASFLESRGVRAGQVVGSTGFSGLVETVAIAASWHLATVSCTLTPRFLADPPFEVDRVVTSAPQAGVPADRQIVVDEAALHSLGGHSALRQPSEYPSVDDVCRLVFSSGTTGRPKAIPFTVRRLNQRIRSARERWMPELPFLSCLGVTTVSGFQSFAESLRSGRPFFVADTAEATDELLRRHGVRSLKASPVQLSGLLGLWESGTPVPPSLRVIQTAGAALPNRLRDRLVAATGARIVNLYGSSEVGTVAVGEPPDSDTGYAGVIVDDVEIEVVDDERRPVAPGERGLIRVRRRGQPTGYFRDEESSRDVFVDGWFYPGDTGSIAEGRLFVHGRRSELINAAGVKVEPQRVELALERLPEVEDAAAFPVVGELGVTEIAVAYTSAGELDARRLREHCRGILGDATPRHYVRVERIPRNDNGKILRRELPAITGLGTGGPAEPGAAAS